MRVLRHRELVLGSLFALVLAGIGVMAVAGPLNPPNGAVSSTYKTLSEVEPRIAINQVNTPGNSGSIYVISQPGSYYLTENLTGVSGKHGIAIAASGVSIDLNGFAVIGVSGSFDGVTATAANLRNLEVRNGAVRNWGSDGVDFYTVNAVNCLIRDIRADGNAGWGITPGDGSTISGCTSSNNASNGMTAKDGCTVVDCTVLGNGAVGIETGSGCTVSNCSASKNRTGIVVRDKCNVSGCCAKDNQLEGIFTGGNCYIFNNQCSSPFTNGTIGIVVQGAQCRIERNLMTNCQRGLQVRLSGNLIVANVASGNSINWDIAAANVGQFVFANSSGAAFSGSVGGAPIGSTDPWVNVSF